PPCLRCAPEKEKKEKGEEEKGRGKKRKPSACRRHHPERRPHCPSLRPGHRRSGSHRNVTGKRSRTWECRRGTMSSLPSRHRPASPSLSWHSVASPPRHLDPRRAPGSSEDPEDQDYFDDVDYAKEKDNTLDVHAHPIFLTY
ncbi:unnamed protein product, partial [Urochloa humidicola]